MIILQNGFVLMGEVVKGGKFGTRNDETLVTERQRETERQSEVRRETERVRERERE